MRQKNFNRLSSGLNQDSIEYTASSSSYDKIEWIERHFKLTQENLNKLGVVLEKYTHSKISVQILSAFTNYLEKNQDLSTKHLIFEYSKDSKLQPFDDELLPVFMETLKKISEKSKVIKEVSIHALFTENQIKALRDYIVSNNISVLLNVPNEFSTYQKEMDQHVARVRTEKRANRLIPQLAIQTKTTTTKKRTRLAQAKPQELALDVDVQQEIQMDLSVLNSETNSDWRKAEIPGWSFGWTLDDLINKFSQLDLQPGAGLLTKAQLKKYWFTWVGNDVQQITPEAIIQLLNNKSRLNGRLHLNSPRFLPKGFTLVTYANPELDYSLKYPSKTKDIVPVIKDTTTIPLTFDLTKKIMDALDTNRTIKQWYLRLDEGPYNRNHFDLFKKHLPTLNLMHPEVISELWKMEQDFGMPLVDYLLENYEAIKKVLDQQDQFFINNLKNDIKHWFNIDSDVLDINKIYTIVTRINTPTNYSSLNKSLLELVVPGTTPLGMQLKYWKNKLKLDEKQLNGLLNLYSDYDEKGLHTLFDYWNTLDSMSLTFLCHTLFKNGDSFSVMLDREFTDAMTLIKRLEERPDGKAVLEWWVKLLKQHTDHVGYDDFSVLVITFSNFVKHIDKLGLSFYKNPQLEQVTSLPNALANMVITLEQTKKGELRNQWEQITTHSTTIPKRPPLGVSQEEFDNPISSENFGPKSIIFPEEILVLIQSQPQKIRPYIYRILNQFDSNSERRVDDLNEIYNALTALLNKYTESQCQHALMALSSEVLLHHVTYKKSHEFCLFLSHLRAHDTPELLIYFVDRAAQISSSFDPDILLKAGECLIHEENIEGGITSFVQEAADEYKNLSSLDVMNWGFDCFLKIKFTDEIRKEDSFWPIVKAVLKKVNTLVGFYPELKESLLSLTMSYIQVQIRCRSFFQLLHDLNDVSILQSLCEHFTKAPQELADLIEAFENVDKENKKFCFQVWAQLKSNELVCTKEELLLLAEHNQSPANRDFFKAIYNAKPPYPTLTKTFEWIDTQKSASNPLSPLESLKAFKRNPCPREPNNGFNLELAKTISIPGITLEPTALETLDREIKNAQTLMPDEIIEALQASRRGDTVSPERLIALTAELLYKTKGRPGNSFEINTTQYLELYTMLKLGRIASEIATGEGKSRINMIYAVCQYSQGNTPDCSTSNHLLAHTLYNEFKLYLESVAPRVIHIDKDTLPERYSPDGKNFDVIVISDINSLQSFRNKAYVANKGQLILHPDRRKRSLIDDEGDKTLYDLSDKRFNFSKKQHHSKQPTWIYDVLVGFFEEVPQANSLYFEDIDACNEAFYNYAASQLVGDQDKLDFIRTIPQDQLELWHTSAYSALTRVFNKEFIIETNKQKVTPRGLKLVSEVTPVVGKHSDTGSKMSFGEHECLHARLNRLKQGKGIAKAGDAELINKLKECKYNFYIEAENTILYSSSSASLLEDYSDGSLSITTGTFGTKSERNEAQLHNPGLHFVKFPRHVLSIREDHPSCVVDDTHARYEKLLEEIKNSIDKKQPVQVFLESGKESLAFHTWLTTKLPHSPIKHIHVEMTPESIDHYMKHDAGKEGHITISTEMIGRGTHSVLHGESKKVGFKALIGYLPHEKRSLNQIRGRAARYGVPGETQLIVDKVSLKNELGNDFRPELNTMDADECIKLSLKLFQSRIQRERIIKNAVTLFRMDSTRYFYDTVLLKFPLSEHKLPPVEKHLSPEERKAVIVKRREIIQKQTAERKARNAELKKWAHFVKQADLSWNAIWPELKKEIHEKPIHFEKIDSLLKNYRTTIEKKWADRFGTELGGNLFFRLILSHEKKGLLTQQIKIEHKPPKNVSSEAKAPVGKDSNSTSDKEKIEIPYQKPAIQKKKIQLPLVKEVSPPIKNPSPAKPVASKYSKMASASKPDSSSQIMKGLSRDKSEQATSVTSEQSQTALASPAAIQSTKSQTMEESPTIKSENKSPEIPVISEQSQSASTSQPATQSVLPSQISKGSPTIKYEEDPCPLPSTRELLEALPYTEVSKKLNQAVRDNDLQTLISICTLTGENKLKTEDINNALQHKPKPDIQKCLLNATKIGKLYQEISALKLHAKELTGAEQSRSYGLQAVTIAEQLIPIADKYIIAFVSAKEDIKFVQQEFKTALKNGFNTMREHRAKWKLDIANVLLAATGIGLLINYKVSGQLFFSNTTRQNKVQAIINELNSLEKGKNKI